MKIGLIRHSRVINDKILLSTGKIFEQSRIRYDSAPIELVLLKIKSEDYPVCYASSKTRARQTAKMIYEGNIIICDDLIEVPNSTFFLLRVPLPSFLRALIGRIAWFFNYHKMPETRKQSTARAQRFINMLLSETKENALIVTHGFFMQCLQRDLKKRGFKGDISYFPKNAKLYTLKK
ncbi:MAG: histidine phosphatase family protein [Bacteroidia bacterium]